MNHAYPSRIDEMVSLWVGNLTHSITREDLRRAFERFGEIGDIYIPQDPDTGRSKGFGYVRFYYERHAEYAIEAMDGRAIVDGRVLNVKMANRRNRWNGKRFLDMILIQIIPYTKLLILILYHIIKFIILRVFILLRFLVSKFLVVFFSSELRNSFSNSTVAIRIFSILASIFDYCQQLALIIRDFFTR